MKVALQIDYLDKLDSRGDTSFFIALGLQIKSHDIYFFHPGTVICHNGIISAEVGTIELSYNDGQYHYQRSPFSRTDLAEFDLILIRQDPPYNMSYIANCQLLMGLIKRCRILNNPASLIEFPEKLSVMGFPQYIPDTIVCTQITEYVGNFINQHQTLIAKPLYGFAGLDVHLIKYSDNWQGDVQKFIDTHTAIILQQFLPNVMEYGDKRVFMIEGEIVGAFSRIPTAGEIRANIAVGGTAFPTKLTTNEIEICNQLSTMLKENDLFFAGIDLLDEHLIEINVTSPTGLTTLMQLGQIDFTDVAEIIERAC